jgi:hypothetical protein
MLLYPVRVDEANSHFASARNIGITKKVEQRIEVQAKRIEVKPK